MADIIKFKRGKSTTWKTKNLLLLDGEPGFEIDTLRLKIGDGKTKWNDLPYQDQNNENVAAKGRVQGRLRGDPRGQAARSGRGQRRGQFHEGLGHRARRDAFYPLVPAHDRHHGGKARLVHLPHRGRRRHHGVFRQGAHPG